MLPQDDDNIEQRQKELDEKKTIYEFDWRVPGMIPLTKNVPADEEFPKEVKVRIFGPPQCPVNLLNTASTKSRSSWTLSSWEVTGTGWKKNNKGNRNDPCDWVVCRLGQYS